MTGFEPATSGSTIRRSNQLSYTHHSEKTLGTGSVVKQILAKTEEAPQPGRMSRVNREETSVRSSFPLPGKDDDRRSTPGMKGLLHFRKNGGSSSSRI